MGVMHPALRRISEEHRATVVVLQAMQESCSSKAPADFARLREILAWLDRPEARTHHELESSRLFPRIRERCPPLRPVLDRLLAEDKRCERTIDDLRQALASWELEGDTGREPFATLARMYIRSYLGYIEVEDGYVLQVAQDYLTESDWIELDATFVG